MFRIVLEINDLPLLKNLKPALIRDISREFFSLSADAEFSAEEGTSLIMDIENDPAQDIAVRLSAFYEYLKARRLKLHGFLLGLDYAPRNEPFMLHPDGRWSAVVSGVDMLLISDPAYLVMAPYTAAEQQENMWRVTGLQEIRNGGAEAFHLASDPANLELVRTAFHAWENGEHRTRPLYLHSLSEIEQYRLALAVSAEAETEEYFPLVDLQYPWRSVAGAFVGCFGPDVLSRLEERVPESRREIWLKRGRTLLEGYNLFSEEDAIAWLGDAFEAYAHDAVGQEKVPVVAIVGADRLNRAAKRILERLLMPLHERGILFCILFGGSPPSRRRGSFAFAELNKAPAFGESRREMDAAVTGAPENTVILLHAALFAPFFKSSDLQSRLYDGGHPKHQVDRLFSDLIDAGHVFKTWRFFFPEVRVPFRPSRRDYSSRALQPFLAPPQGISAAPFGLEYASIAAALAPEAGENIFSSLLHALYERGYGDAGSAVATVFGMLPGRYRYIKQIVRSMQRVFAGQPAELSIQNFGSEKHHREEALWHILETEELLRTGDISSALGAAKNFLYRVQEQGEACQISQAQNALGSAMLWQGKIEEANDYFSLAHETSKNCASSMDRIRSCMNRGLALYLFGNYSRADRLLSEGIEAAAGLCHGPYLLFARFLKGRIAFTLGRYEQAEEEFWASLSYATLLGEPHPVFYAWIGRAKIYRGEVEEGISLLQELPAAAEVFYYLAEGRYFDGKTEQALDFIRRAAKLVKVESPGAGGFGSYSWDTGYRNIEDCAFHGASGRRVLQNCVTAFRWFLESRADGGDEGREFLERITRGEKLGELDPFLHFYFLIHALLIPEDTHNEALERITYLSKGLKYLQRIGSVIDDVPSRLDFLSKNRWNKYLMDLARKEKLV